MKLVKKELNISWKSSGLTSQPAAVVVLKYVTATQLLGVLTGVTEHIQPHPSLMLNVLTGASDLKLFISDGSETLLFSMVLNLTVLMKMSTLKAHPNVPRTELYRSYKTGQIRILKLKCAMQTHFTSAKNSTGQQGQHYCHEASFSYWPRHRISH